MVTWWVIVSGLAGRYGPWRTPQSDCYPGWEMWAASCYGYWLAGPEQVWREEQAVPSVCLRCPVTHAARHTTTQHSLAVSESKILKRVSSYGKKKNCKNIHLWCIQTYKQKYLRFGRRFIFMCQIKFLLETQTTTKYKCLETNVKMHKRNKTGAWSKINQWEQKTSNKGEKVRTHKVVVYSHVDTGRHSGG